MEIDHELAMRMQKIAAREHEIAQERQELKIAAQQELAVVDRRIDEIRDLLDGLEEKREELARFLGLPSSSDHTRLAHGELKEKCLEALNGHDNGLRSSDLKQWIERKYPGTRVASVPATLSRQVEYGLLMRDELGRYKINRRS